MLTLLHSLHSALCLRFGKRFAKPETMLKFLLVLVVALALIEAKPPRQHCSKVRGRPCTEDNECACVNRHNSTLICNYNNICERRTFVDDIKRKQPCHRIFKRSCHTNADCPCNEGRLICEENECVKYRPKRKIHQLAEIMMNKQPCPRIFKNSCLTNADCPCSEARLVCEDNECVKDRFKQETHQLVEIMNKLPCPGIFKSSCLTNADCTCNESRLVCEDNKCVKDRQATDTSASGDHE